MSNQDWDVTPSAPREAWAEITNENEFNDPPEAGMEFWIVPVTATYKETTPVTPGSISKSSLSVRITGPTTITAGSSRTRWQMSASFTRVVRPRETYA